jgi:hypothetical protein
MYIFLTIFFIYVIAFLFKSNSKLFGDYDYFSRNNIFRLNNSVPNSDQEDSEDCSECKQKYSEDKSYEDDGDGEDEISDLENTYDKLSEDEYIQ